MKLPVAAMFLAATAHAGGLARPNAISARGVGMGGAFAAWADDASALWFNPAAMSEVEPQVDVGGELVVGPRSYTPIVADGSRGPAQRTTVVAPLPSAGVVGRFTDDDRPSRFTLGAGLWNTFGGKVKFPQNGMPALDATQDAAIEANAGAALWVSDRLSIGAALRIGLGLFSTDTTMLPYDAHLSATGVGLGATLGALVRPVEAVRIGIAWHSPMHITTSGDGTITTATGPMQQAIEHDQPWPQQASLGVGWRAAPAIRLAAQLDWTQWSAVDQLAVRFPASSGLDQVYPEGWHDSWTVRLGGEYTVSRAVALRTGAYFDSSAVPDRTIERQYLDSNKFGVAAGASLRFADWRVDAAVDFVVPNTRTVPNNTAETSTFRADANKAPGDYTATLTTFELAVTRRF